MIPTLIGTALGMALVSVIAGTALAKAQHAVRLAAEASTRITMLSAGAGVVTSPSCPTCGTPLQRAMKPHEGQTHYCPRCSLWMVVAGA